MHSIFSTTTAQVARDEMVRVALGILCISALRAQNHAPATFFGTPDYAAQHVRRVWEEFFGDDTPALNFLSEDDVNLVSITYPDRHHARYSINWEDGTGYVVRHLGTCLLPKQNITAA